MCIHVYCRYLEYVTILNETLKSQSHIYINENQKKLGPVVLKESNMILLTSVIGQDGHRLQLENVEPALIK